jgi:hypothetical protein
MIRGTGSAHCQVLIWSSVGSFGKRWNVGGGLSGVIVLEWSATDVVGIVAIIQMINLEKSGEFAWCGNGGKKTTSGVFGDLDLLRKIGIRRL